MGSHLAKLIHWYIHSWIKRGPQSNTKDTFEKAFRELRSIFRLIKGKALLYPIIYKAITLRKGCTDIHGIWITKITYIQSRKEEHFLCRGNSIM